MPALIRAAVVGAVAVSSAAIGGTSLASPAPAAAAGHAVQISDSAFGPGTLTVQVGDTVTWTNADDRPHTVTSTDGTFDSGNLDEGGAYSFTFTAPGTYGYLCEYHPDMTATIVVEAAAAPANPQPSSTAPPAGGTASAPGHAVHGAGTGAPDTAVGAPTRQIPAISFLLWGAALLLLAMAFAPSWTRAAAAASPRPTGGWRR